MAQHEDLARTLRRELDNAHTDEIVVTIHLFGIDHARELDDLTINELRNLAEKAGTHRSYGTELRKGIKLADFVRRR